MIVVVVGMWCKYLACVSFDVANQVQWLEGAWLSNVMPLASPSDLECTIAENLRNGASCCLVQHGCARPAKHCQMSSHKYNHTINNYTQQLWYTILNWSNYLAAGLCKRSVKNKHESNDLRRTATTLWKVHPFDRRAPSAIEGHVHSRSSSPRPTTSSGVAAKSRYVLPGLTSRFAWQASRGWVHLVTTVGSGECFDPSKIIES